MKEFFFGKSVISVCCLGFISLAVLAGTAHAKPGTGQQNPPCPGGGKGDCPPKGGNGCGSVGANPINAAKANAFREIIDIQTFGPAPIEWGRTINSREYQHNGNSYWEFGYYGTLNTGAQWQSSWQNNWAFEIFNKNSSSTVLTVRYPNGNDYDFTYSGGSLAPVGAQFVPTAENGDRLYKTASSPDKFMLVTPSGEEFHFERWTASYPYLRLAQKRDGLGSYWDVSYNDPSGDPREYQKSRTILGSG